MEGAGGNMTNFLSSLWNSLFPSKPEPERIPEPNMDQYLQYLQATQWRWFEGEYGYIVFDVVSMDKDHNVVVRSVKYVSKSGEEEAQKEEDTLLTPEQFFDMLEPVRPGVWA